MEQGQDYLNYNKGLEKNARLLRKNMTRQERRLWYNFLRGYSPKFYRQKIIDNFIVDFYCAKAKLAVELDGSQHYSDEGERYDAYRTDVISGYGIYVVRFSNLDVDRNFEGVCMRIDELVKLRLRPHHR